MDKETFRYDLAGNEPRVILITDLVGSRRAVPRLGYVVLPQFSRLNRRAPTFAEAFGFVPYGEDVS